MKTLVLAFSFLLATSANAQCLNDDSFANYFKEFRNSVLTKDPHSVAKLARFPFEAKDQLDTEVPMLVSKKKFVFYYKYLMQLEVENPIGVVAVSSLREHLLSVDPATDARYKKYCHLQKGISVIHPGTPIYVSVLRFERSKQGNWQLTGGYLGDLYSNIRDDTEPAE